MVDLVLDNLRRPAGEALEAGHYAVCLRSPNGKGTEAGAMAAHQALYAAQFPRWAYEKFIQIPRDPEHPLQPPESWAEQTTLPGLEA